MHDRACSRPGRRGREPPRVSQSPLTPPGCPQEAEAVAAASRGEAARERERASALEGQVCSYRKREEEYFQRFRQHEEDFAQRTKDMREREKECERKLLAAENLFNYCSKHGSTAVDLSIPVAATPLTLSHTDEGTTHGACLTPGALDLEAEPGDPIAEGGRIGRGRDLQAVGGRRGRGDDEQEREGDQSEVVPRQTLLTSPLPSAATPEAALWTPAPTPYASLSGALTPADVVGHWQQVQRHVLERESLLEQLEAEVGQREDEKLQLINDVAQKSIELLHSKSCITTLQDEIAELQKQREELEADRAKQTRSVEETRRLAAQELNMEREKLIQGWEDEMRAERGRRERALEEERAQWNQRLVREREAWEQKLRDEGDAWERKIDEQWAVRRDEEERKNEERARERANLERAVEELKIELHRLQEDGRRERGLLLVQERGKMQDIAALEESLTRLKTEEEGIREIIKRQRARASELEAVLVLQETERVGEMRALVDEISRLKSEKEALGSWLDLRRKEEEAILRGRTREAEEQRRLFAMERQEQERVRGVLEREIDGLIVEEQRLREKVQSRLKVEEEMMRERMKKRIVEEEASLRESARLRVSEEEEGLRAIKRMPTNVVSKGGTEKNEDESQLRGVKELVDKREIREVLTELLRNSAKSEQGQQEMERMLTERSMDRGYMTLGDLARGSQEQVTVESFGGGGVRGAVKSLKSLSQKWKLEKEVDRGTRQRNGEHDDTEKETHDKERQGERRGGKRKERQRGKVLVSDEGRQKMSRL